MSIALFMRHASFLLPILALAAFPARGSSPSDAAPSEAPAERPKWLEKARDAHAELMKAAEAGDERNERRRLARLFKLLAEEADGSALLELRSEMSDLLSRWEEGLAPVSVPEGEALGVAGALEVTEEELSEAVPAVAPHVDAKLGYAMSMDPDDPEVKKIITLFTTVPRHRKNLQAVFNKMALYRTMILKEIEALKLPRELLYLPIVESEYNTRAVSRAGAVGLWQFMPTTGRNMGLKVNYWVDERLDAEKSTRAALRHLKDLYDWFQSWPLALAAYNRGIYGLQRDLASTRAPDFSAVAGRGGLPQETTHYVPKFKAMTLIADNAEEYGFTLPPAQIMAAADEIVLSKPLDLKVAAGCAGVSEADIRALNPTLRLWCTPKNEESFTLKVPRGSRKKTESCLARTKDWTPGADVVKYRVKRGDYLGRIASMHKTTVKAVMAENRITDPKRLRAGQVLVIRPGRGYKGQ